MITTNVKVLKSYPYINFADQIYREEYDYGVFYTPLPQSPCCPCRAPVGLGSGTDTHWARTQACQEMKGYGVYFLNSILHVNEVWEYLNLFTNVVIPY